MTNKININNFKLIVSDIDDTIVCTSNQIGNLTKKTIKNLKNKGLLFTLATGRNMSSARNCAEQLNVELPLVLSNGCVVQTLSGDVLHHAKLQIEITKKTIEIANKHNMYLSLVIGDQVYFKKGYDDSKFPGNVEYRHEIADWSRISDHFDLVNKCVVHERKSEEKIRLLEEIYKKEFSGKAEFYRSGLSYLEVAPLGISKAVGVEIIAKNLGITMDQVIAIGDYDNDLELISKAGLGIAVKNATEKVKENADLIIDSCSEEGPAKFIQKLFV